MQGGHTVARRTAPGTFTGRRRLDAGPRSAARPERRWIKALRITNVAQGRTGTRSGFRGPCGQGRARRAAQDAAISASLPPTPHGADVEVWGGKVRIEVYATRGISPSIG